MEEKCLPNSENLTPKLAADKEITGLDFRLENLKSSLRLAYKSVEKANKQSHVKNKQYYDKKAKQRRFQLGNKVYLYNPARKVGKCFKFHKFWTGPFEITAKLSDLNHEITSMSKKKQVVHVNRLKMAHDPKIWRPKPNPETLKKRKNREAENPEEQAEENEMQFGSLPLQRRDRLVEGLEPRTPSNQVPCTPQSASQTTISPHSERRDPSYKPPQTPRSRRELSSVRPEPPLTRSRTRIQTQDPGMS
jgi:hypothetical protein